MSKNSSMSEVTLKSIEKFDLTNCDQEPIHIPGAIQPHGLLFVLKEPELTILQVSKNTLNILGIPAEELIDKNLNSLLDEYHIEFIKSCLLQEDLRNKNPLKFSIKADNRTLLFDGIIHRSNGDIILELETSRFAQNISFLNFYDLVRSSISKIQNVSNLRDMCQNLVQEISRISGFDRVMIYQFDSEQNGMVIAEKKVESLQSFLGLHYPASDIPKQARRLYVLNWLRLIPDINYQPVEIVPGNNPIDMSHSILRSVSPLHIEYLQNMGIRASMSISLVKDNQLWGLIACHHYAPKYISYEVRKACEFLGQVMSLELIAKEEHEDYDYKITLKSVQEKIFEYMSVEENFIDGLTKFQPNLLDLVSAKGAVICFEGNYTIVGETPGQQELKLLINNLENSFNDGLFYTDCLTKIYPESENIKNTASGLLAISISKAPRNYVLWFRPEVIQSVNWAGDPNKPVITAEDGSFRLSPRKSFDLWKQTVKLKSLPWQKCEIDAAKGLRNVLIKIVLQKAEEIAQLNLALQKSEAHSRKQAAQLAKTLQDLQRTQTHLIQSEKMSSLGQLVAGVAHEINNPINFIYGNLNHAKENTQDLLNLINLYQQYYPSPPSKIQEEIENMDLEFVIEDLPKQISSMKLGAERIREIVKSLRNFSRLDEADIKAVNIHEGIDSTLLILQHRLKSSHNDLSIKIIKEYGNLPLVECYAGQLNQVFMNLIANAIDALEEGVGDPQNKTLKPTIYIRTQVNDSDANSLNSWIKISISDNGCGIPEDVQKRIFDPFFTTKPIGKGTGIGLALSYQIVVEKHGGKLTCISTPKKGTEFMIEIPIFMTKASKNLGNGEWEMGNRKLIIDN